MWVSIFSTGKRASKSLLVQIKEIICELYVLFIYL